MSAPSPLLDPPVPPAPRTSEALAALFADAVAPEIVLSDPAAIAQGYAPNVTHLSREVPIVLIPRTEDEVRRIVLVANEHRVALYPFSTGRNWGLGSKLPVTDGCALVDLSRLSRIVEVDDDFGYAIIEPGVTQGQLAAYLCERHPTLTVNFTGSFAHTSIVGNTLDRGDGDIHARVNDLRGVRGVLGSGEMFQAGGVWENVGTGQPSHHVKVTAGPELASLFTQSSFGIVTRLAFKLIRKPQRSYLTWGIVPDAQLEAAVTALRALGQQGVFNLESAQLGYGNRFLHAQDTFDRQVPEEADGWLFYVVVAGTARTADAASQEVVDAMAPLCTRVGAFDPEANRGAEKTLPPSLLPFLKLLRGTPDVESIKVIYQATGTPLPDDLRRLDADAPPFGMKSLVSVIPFSPRHVRTFDRVIQAVRSHGVAVKPSVYGDGRTLVTIPFRRDDPADVARAERAEEALWTGMDEAGFAPYRVAVDRMASLVARDPQRFDLVARLKAALDPNGVVSPGRYARV